MTRDVPAGKLAVGMPARIREQHAHPEVVGPVDGSLEADPAEPSPER